MIADLLPHSVAAAESTGPLAEPEGLFPAEEALVRTAGPGRRAEFSAGRACARAALAGLGLPAMPVLVGRAGEPRWPAGVTGSLTHCAGYRACAVARATDVGGMGIDAEPDAALPAGLIGSIANGAERAWIARQAASAPAVRPAVRPAVSPTVSPAVSWDRLLFSAKEAVGKLWYPLTGHWPGFGQIAVFPDPAGTFEAQVTASGPAPASLTGRWLARGGIIATAVICYA